MQHKLCEIHPQAIAEDVAADKLELTELPVHSEADIHAALAPIVEESLAKIRARRKRREDFIAAHGGEKQGPWVYLIVATGNESQYRAYCAAIGAPELGDDARFATNRLRVANRETLVVLLTDIMRTGTRDDWIAKLEAVGVPCGPINDIAQAFAHPQAQARRLRRDLPHPGGGVAPVTASPLRFSDSPVVYRRAPPLLGQHTEEVLREVLGKSPSAIAEWMATPSHKGD